MTRLNESTLKQVRSLLQDRKRVLLDDLQRDAQALRDDSARTRDPGTDAGDLSESDHAAAVSAGEMARDAAELQAIEQALERMGDDSYGTCADCGDAIAPQRLLASPTALRCVSCQTRFEKTHPGTTPHSL